tara:strand:- start:42383 stop:43336 length:954 start_codon:yes stop_codon:yes gene_type:complete
MAFEAATERNIALKKLLAKAHTTNNKGVNNEAIASQISIAANQIIGEVIPSDPATAYHLGLVEFVEAELELDNTSSGKSYRLKFPDDYGGDFGSGSQGLYIGDVTFAVPFFYNDNPVQSDDSGGYQPRLFDNGVEVPLLDASDWFFDYFACLLTSEDDLSLGSTGTVQLYIYTGTTVQDHIDDTANPHNVVPSQVGGIALWQPFTEYSSGSFVYYDLSSSLGDSNFSNGIYVATSSHTSSAAFSSDQANWKALNSSFQYDQGVGASTWTIDHNLNRYPTITVLSSSGFQIEPEVEYVNLNRVTLRFSPAASGTAYMN